MEKDWVAEDRGRERRGRVESEMAKDGKWAGIKQGVAGGGTRGAGMNMGSQSGRKVFMDEYGYGKRERGPKMSPGKGGC